MPWPGPWSRLGHQVSGGAALSTARCGNPGRPFTSTGQTLSIPLVLEDPAGRDLYLPESDPNLNFYFIGQDALFNREGLYGTAYGDFDDNAERFIFFSAGPWWR